MNFNLIDITESAIRTKIGNIGRSESSRRENIQTACIYVCAHGLRYGSSPLGTLLLAKLTMQADKRAVGAWLSKFGPFVINGGTDVVFSKKIRADRFGAYPSNDEVLLQTYVDELASDETPMWYESKQAKAKAAGTKDASELFAKLVKSLKRANTDDDTPVENVGLLSYIEGAIARYHADVALANAQADARKELEAEQAAELEAKKIAQREHEANDHRVPEADEVVA